MKKFGKAMVATVMLSVMVGSTVFATPTVGELREDKEKAEKELKNLESDMTSLMKKINKADKELVKVGQAII